jgi:phosphoribosylanthranilate isomerase
MPLKTLVKVGSISNLSDARYCAGMGVDMLGFRVIEGQPNFIAPKLYQEIRGWVSGPKFIAELYGITRADIIKSLIEDYAPDYLELSLTEYQVLKHAITLPAIILTTADELQSLHPDPTIKYYIIDEDSASSLSGDPHVPLLVKILKKENLDILEKNPALKGVALNGSPEIRPGFKNYEDLADVLELLDE